MHNKNAKNDSIRQRTPPPQRPLSFQHQRPCSFLYYHERTASKSHPHPRPCLRHGGWYRVRSRIRPRNYSTELLPRDNDGTNNEQKEGLKFRLQNHGAQTQNEDRANKTCCLTATGSCPYHNGLVRSKKPSTGVLSVASNFATSTIRRQPFSSLTTFSWGCVLPKYVVNLHFRRRSLRSICRPRQHQSLVPQYCTALLSYCRHQHRFATIMARIVVNRGCQCTMMLNGVPADYS